MDASEEAVTLPSKPIVSDMTVSSRDSKTDESRDENTHHHEGDASREGIELSKKSKPAPAKSKGSKAKQGNSSSGGNHRYQYPNSGGNNGQLGHGGPTFPMNRGPPYNSGPPPYYHGPSYGPPHGGHGGPPPHHHQGGPPMMPYHNGGPYGMNRGPPPPPQYHSNFPPPPPHYGGGPGPGPYSMHYGMPPNFPPMNQSDSASVSSQRSKESSSTTNKKRTIEGVHGGNLPSSYTFRRTDSNSSAASTITAGNNTSAETISHMEESPNKKERADLHPPLNRDMQGLTFEDHQSTGVSAATHPSKQKGYHRRDYSAASTASSLSVGGFSLGSYEPRVGAVEDPMIAEPTPSSKRLRPDEREPLLIDTQMRPPSALPHAPGAEQSSRFEQMSIDASKHPTSTSSAESAGHDRNLFLSLSTSPINHDVDATPVSKNTKQQKKPEGKADQKKGSIFKAKGGPQPKIETAPSDVSRPSDTPTPPVHREMGTSLTDEHSVLNRHLRNQSFTPLPHLSTNESSKTTDGSVHSPSAAAFVNAIAPQLSWSIAGDTPSLGDLAEWDEEHKLHIKTDQKHRPGSTSSAESHHMAISPHDFQFWKEDHVVNEPGQSGTTTPLPAFFEHGVAAEGAENHMQFDRTNKKNDGMFTLPTGLKNSNKPLLHTGWKHHEPSADPIMSGMPPTPMFASSDFRDDGFGPRSPIGGDRREGLDFYPSGFPHHPGDRVRNLRGRLPGHMPPMPLHIPPPMTAHLPMTSPMGLGPKAGLWSPHHHPGMPPLASPHHLGSPLNNMAQSKRKCIPLKPPIPSKFQGNIEKVKSASVPEFTSLVNFPGHMSQKQSVNLPDGMRCCVMCGQACPCSNGTKCKKKKGDGLGPRGANGQDCGDKNIGFAIIPTQNKGLCTLCDVNVWVVVSSGLEIKWCKGCKNFRPWAAFGDKGLATKCLRCRERQREKYALQKEEKDKTRQVVKVKK